MSKKLSPVLWVCLVIFVNTQIGHASLVLQTTFVKSPPGTPFLAPDAALPSPWRSYQLAVVTTGPGELIGAVEVTFTGNKLHQRWNDIDFDGDTDPSPNGAASNGRGDSHLTAPAGSPFGFGPTETNTKVGSPLTSVPGTTEYGLGNLGGAWGLLTPASTANIAYIVTDRQFTFDGFLDLPFIIKAANPAGVRYNDIVNVPEPTALALFAIVTVCLGFIRRR